MDCRGTTTTMLLVPEEEWRNLHDTLEQIIDLITRRNADDSNGFSIPQLRKELLKISQK